ncbi:MAG: T9SS type A sorting domain-containing protein [Bacteroidota bacterium]|jgi:hypothetical protein
MRSFIFLAILFLTYNKAMPQWAQSNTPATFKMKDASFTGNSTVITLHDKYTYLSADKGESFTQISDFSGNTIQAINDSTYIVCRGTFISFTNNKGANWNKLQIKNISGDTIYKGDILFTHFYNNGKAIAIGDKYNGDSCNNIFLSDDWGISWKKKKCENIQITYNPPPLAMSGFSNKRRYEFGGTLFINSFINKTKFFVISDYGNMINEVSWDALFSDFSTLTDCAFKDSLNGIVLSSGNAYKTVDGLKSVQKINTPENFTLLTYAKPTPSKPKGFYFASCPNGSYTSSDDGANWNQVDLQQYLTAIFNNTEQAISCISSNGYKVLYFTGFSSIKESDVNPKLLVYPNPAKDNLYIDDANQKGTYDLVDIHGQILSKGNIESGKRNLISLNGFSNGLYFLRCSFENQTNTYKVIVN